MTRETAHAIAARVRNSIQYNKQRPVALFVHAEGFEIASVHASTYRRNMARFAYCLVGVYNAQSPIEHIVDDVLTMKGNA